MPRKQKPRQTKASRRYGSYLSKLSAVREYVAGFDSKALDKLYLSKPRTDAGKRKRRSALAKVSAKFRTLKPYITGNVKKVAARGDKLKQLREYVDLPNIKGLRAVPVEVINPKKAKISFDKKGRLNIKEGARKEVLIRFSRKPKAHRAKDGRFITAGEDVLQLLRELMPKLPQGLYVLNSKRHMLIPVSADKAALEARVKDFIYAYDKHAPDFVSTINGVRWMAQSAESFMKRQAEMQSARTEASRARLSKRRAVAERAARKVAKKGKRK